MKPLAISTTTTMLALPLAKAKFPLSQAITNVPGNSNHLAFSLAKSNHFHYYRLAHTVTVILTINFTTLVVTCV